MEKNYTFGKLLLCLREEYKQTKPLLEKLNNCVTVNPNNSNFYFEGRLLFKEESILEENRLRLIAQKKYLKMLKQIQSLRYDWYSKFLYTAHFNVSKNDDNNSYKLVFDDILTPVDNKNRFVPQVNIINQETFNDIINKILSLDIMQLHREILFVNHDIISIDFSNIFMSSTLGYKLFISWDGKTDTINYSAKKDYSIFILEKLLSLQIPSNSISPEWLQFFEKYEHIIGKDIYFDVALSSYRRKKGSLQIDTIDNTKVKLLRKQP